jgi:hypothetical protein
VSGLDKKKARTKSVKVALRNLQGSMPGVTVVFGQEDNRDVAVARVRQWIPTAPVWPNIATHRLSWAVAVKASHRCADQLFDSTIQL